MTFDFEIMGIKSQVVMSKTENKIIVEMKSPIMPYQKKEFDKAKAIEDLTNLLNFMKE